MFQRSQTQRLRPGVNIFGYVFAEHGVGESARLVIQSVRQAGLDYAVIPYTDTCNRQQALAADLGSSEAVYDVNLIIVNADSLPRFVDHFGPEILRGRYNIGQWAWEIESLPGEMTRTAQHLDEIWAISEFTAQAISRSVSCPVFPVPLTSTMRQPVRRTRRDLGLWDDFLFLFCFDFNSLFERKNPLAVIAAFKEAFPPGSGAKLLIKCINGVEYPHQLPVLDAAALDHPDVVIADGYLPAEEQQALMASCDAYVSLHRSEGFGLTLLEAMAYGKPVIATGYSGNLDFMNEDNGYLVPYEMVRLPPRCGPYPETSRWADPDVAAASRLMRRVFDHREEARKKADQARRDVAELHTPQARADLIVRRLQAIRRDLDTRPRPPGPFQTLVAAGTEPEAAVGVASSAGVSTAQASPFRSFASVGELLANQLPRFDGKNLLDLRCGSLDGVTIDERGGAVVWGWAYDPRTLTAVRGVVLLCNGRQIPLRINLGGTRQDVAAHLGDEGLTQSGWSVYVPANLLHHGKNAFVAYALLAEGTFAPILGHGAKKIVVMSRH